MLNRIAKRYGPVWAVRDVGLHVDRGQTLALIGPSGCGKSTLLRMMIGLIEPTSGELQIDGEPVARGGWRRLRQRIGYVIQDGGLLPHLTLRRNITLPFRAAGAARPDVGDLAARVDELAAMTSLDTALLDRFPREVSGGQRQRAALMRALITRPELLLLDEPLGALDPQIRADLQRELKALIARLDKAVVLVTHDLAEAAYLADEIALMQQGRIVQRGSFEELASRPADPFVEAFIAAQVERVRGLLAGMAA